MQKFKKGDKITCDSIYASWLTEGKNYEVMDAETGSTEEYVVINNDCGISARHPSSIFTLHTPKQTDMIPEGLEKFDLETALKEPGRVVTRDGRSISELHYFYKADVHFPIYCVIDGNLFSFQKTGESGVSAPSDYDLFLRAKEVVKYVTDYGAGKNTGGSYRNLEDAIREAPMAIAIVALTYRANQLVDVKIAHRF